MVTMKPPKKASSSIASTGYDPTTQTLAVHFKNSPLVYHYQSVPQHVVDAMHSAESIGKFVAGHIVGKFDHQAHEVA